MILARRADFILPDGKILRFGVRLSAQKEALFKDRLWPDRDVAQRHPKKSLHR